MSAIYPKAKETWLSSGFNLLTEDLRVILIDTGQYTFSAAHQFLTDVIVGSRTFVSDAMTTKAVANGVFDADDVALANVTGLESEALIIYRHTGVEATADLIAYIDSATGLPVLPNSGNINITWDNGANKIFAL